MSSEGLIDSANSELFNTYETDYQVSYNEAKQKLSQIRDLDGALEVQNIQSSARSSYNSKIRSYRSDVEQIKKELKRYLDDEDRRQLFGSKNNGRDQQRSQLLQSNAALERTSQRLKDSSRIANETEQIGSNIMLDLRSQREQLTNSRNTLFEADGYVDKSIQTLKSMTRRMATNKIITYSIIAVLIILIFLVIASKFW
ncbi:Vesicle soluble NSF attachment protein receptor [Wickerhamomyces ciferrii]|uniref:Vesicle soluble NSF attachment protein receptor n=1 Tax=Wickerhamomyces ciferrii (strain ATCC 14091 / BCRC 22168 / CBS 111 / JCM 3599 / NBRC 0793 / NRRL Y-1031 F-60-10) TaxID=1206466 RepID=K0KDV7_WICCF|nr:Vesicle soluble NSF attachment protein receptor [Wickerhamomyces ciferrii]CCH41116.1 Vesicle soluble NSF attachment protein receptor [Wickerhamomyces ciferrii]